MISININKWRNYFSIKNIFGTASILFYVLNPIPIIYNVHIADVFMLLYFILNIFSIYKHSFSSIVYRNIFPIFVLFILFSLISGFNAYNIETHILAIFQFVFVFFIVIPSLLYFLVNDVSKILKLLPKNYVFLNYSYVIKDSSLYTFHRDVTSSKSFNHLTYPSYTLIIYFSN